MEDQILGFKSNVKRRELLVSYSIPVIMGSGTRGLEYEIYLSRLTLCPSKAGYS